MTRLAPQHPRQLRASKWTCCAPETERPGGFVHFTVIEVSGDAAVLEAVLDPAVTVRVLWRSLRDRARWQPDWR